MNMIDQTAMQPHAATNDQSRATQSALIDAHMNALTDTKAVAKLTRGNPDD